MRPTRIMALAGAALLASAAPAPASAAPAPPPRVTADGADLIVVTAGPGRLSLRLREAGEAPDAAGREPGSVRLGPAGGLTARVPADPDFAFLGAPGTAVWSLSAGGPGFPALDTTGVRPGTVRGDVVTLDLAGVRGPGSFAAYTLSPWGRPTILLDSDGATTTRLPVGRRLGGLAWTFDAPGEYRLTFRVTASAPAGGTLHDEASYLVEVPALAPGEPVVAATAPGTAPATSPAGARALAVQTGTPAAGARTVISAGHVDMGPQLDGGAWRVRLKDDSTSPATWRELADVVLKVTDKAKVAVPSGAGYAFLGAAGSTVYLLPQSQQSGIVWPGWNTQHESVVNGTRGNVTWRLKGVTGPGEFKLFLTGSFGTPEVLFDSAKSLPQQVSIPPNTHAHGNWAFTRAGHYQLAVEMTGTTIAGTPVSDTRTLSVAVGDATDAQAGFGSDDDAAAGGASAGGGLARTGANVLAAAGVGVLLLAAGALVLIVTRRRSPKPGTPS
ncbi:TIGR03773 family transporter-associated surface protein [Plantactinospora sp. KBS50]|uniref:TIGR03773 family transporter-associated surface protein n=1 Tax=Plantactinospora sp. KBS50 TaxID=2024580 RepID=UPI000BAAF575|nr:TIGR03773 family transporter-associated surface protein [Plantactinospora sp. KBS50]ASW54787.1 hypothetical protein CIK06_12250 [Plantactinospora sp. KBS50]